MHNCVANSANRGSKRAAEAVIEQISVRRAAKVVVISAIAHLGQPLATKY